MHAISLIKRHIFALPLGRIFTTREMLNYGSRSAIDQALSKLVKLEVIVRLARGVFVRAGSDIGSLTVFEIARAKAESFGRAIAPWAGDLAVDLGFLTHTGDDPTFSINASTSSFKLGKLTVRLRKTCPRKMHLTATAPGRLLSALWHLGKQAVRAAPSLQLPWLGRTDREEIRLSLVWLPGWLSATFLHWRLPRCLAVPPASRPPLEPGPT